MASEPKYRIVPAPPGRRRAKPGPARECGQSSTWDEFDGLDADERRQLAIELAQRNVLRALRLTERTWKGLAKFMDEDSALANIAALSAMNESMKTLAAVSVQTFGDPAAMMPAKRPAKVILEYEVADPPPVAAAPPGQGPGPEIVVEADPPLRVVRPDEETDPIWDAIERAANE